MKQNCWEFSKCGREPNGEKTAELGVCPAATETRLNNLHGGSNGGRTCWILAGTLCKGEIQGNFVNKHASCSQCDFYKSVEKEEGSLFIMSATLLSYITGKSEYESQLDKYIRDLINMNDKLSQMANVDALTGTYNRREFDDELNSLITEKDIHTISFSLILFDIDNFKSVNDNFGHKTGDRILQGISALVTANIREEDCLFRWGGEEFILILPGETLDNARDAAERIRSSIQDHDFEIGQPVTISLGVGEYKSGENNNQVIMRVDSALLEAKSEGKNRVVSC